jgi:hypothetical protein
MDTPKKMLNTFRRGLLVEAWKITKVVDIKLLPAPAGSLIPYKISIEGTFIHSPSLTPFAAADTPVLL